MISIVIPAHNEVENIAALLDEIQKATKDLPVKEIIVIDDGSYDQTDRALEKAKAHIPMLRAFRYDLKAGQSAAIYAGVLVASGEWIVTLDGDGQNIPADIQKLYQIYMADDVQDKIGLIAGQRLRRQDSTVKRYGSKVANYVRSKILNDGVRDTGCGLKMIRRDVYMRFPYFNHMHRYLPALVLREGFEIRLVDVGHRQRLGGVSKYGTIDRLVAGIYDLMGVIWLIKRARIVQTLKTL